MNAKHQTKNAISYKFVFLAVGIAIAVIAVFSISATSQAKATEPIKNDSIADSKLYSADESTEVYYESDEQSNIDRELINGETLRNIYESLTRGTWPTTIVSADISQKFHEVSKSLNIRFYDANNSILFYMGASVDCFEEELALDWKYSDGRPVSEEAEPLELNRSYTFCYGDVSLGCNISGHVANADDVWQPVPGAFVQYCHWTPWGSVPVPEMNTFTDWFGNYTIEGVTEDMLPGVIRVYKFGYEVGESAPIWFVPEGLDTIYRFIEMTPSEPPVPPTPPDPPVPPVPPQPDPPQPVPPTPVPPTPVPTPVDPGTNVPQTGDVAGNAFAVFAMLAVVAALSCGVAIRKEYF